MRNTTGAVYALLATVGAVVSVSSHASVWELAVGRDLPVCPCEIEAEKEINHDLFMEMNDRISPKITSVDHLRDLASGKVFVSYHQFTKDDFVREFRDVPTLANHDFFNGAMVTVLSGVFLSQANGEAYHHPAAILSRNRIERTNRKMVFERQLGPHSIEATKTIKFMGQVFTIPFTIEAGWLFHPRNTWIGMEDNRLMPSEISLLTKNLVGDVIDRESIPTHTVQIHAKAVDPLVRGAATVLISYLSPDKKRVLVSFWQIVGANQSGFLNFLTSLPWIGSAVSNKMKLTALRDFARNVDVIRSDSCSSSHIK